MLLTDEQQRAVDEAGNVCLTSCPGSGKTRVIVAKLLRCIEDVRDSMRRVACITHTNAAADEIDIRLRETCYGDEHVYYEVSTIHGFALTNILKPFGHLLPEFTQGFSILTSDSEEFVAKVKSLIGLYDLKAFVAEEFSGIERSPGGVLKDRPELPLAVQEEWCAWLDSNGYVTLGEIVYHAGRLASAYPHISSGLASRYAWLLVDEFQDSSSGQTQLFKDIYAFGRTSFFCVGDPNQSIYGFAGASPELMREFGDHIKAHTAHQLTGNFRSSTKICETAELLRGATPPMRATGPYASWPHDPCHFVVSSAFEGISSHFLPAALALGVSRGQIAVLAPWWIPLFQLARLLRQSGVPTIGPGARPYKRAHTISRLVEPLGAYLESPEAEIAVTVQRALAALIAEMTEKSPNLAFEFNGRLVVCQLLAEASAARASSNRAIDWIVDAAARFAAILIAADLFSETEGKLLEQSAADMAEDIAGRDGGDTLGIEDLGVFARPANCVQLMTIHKAKGREFEAVAVIDAHNGKLPHFAIGKIVDPNERQAQYDESRRVVYVAATRAKRILMFFSDTSHHKNTPSPFLAEMGL